MKKMFLTAFAVLLTCCAFGSVNLSGKDKDVDMSRWTGTWAASAEFTGQGDMPKSSLAGRSIRQVIHVSIGGSRLRLQLSNEFSAEPVQIERVFVADAKDSCDIDVRTARYLTFSGRRNVTIPAGETVFSDGFDYDLKPLQCLAITLCYGSQVPEHATSHRGSRTISYIVSGVAKPKTSFATGERVDHWYNIAALDVVSDSKAVVCLGNSITDGRGSTTNRQNRWTDFLAIALNEQSSSSTSAVAVLNQGIGGNAVLRGGLSEPAVKRFERDVLRMRGADRLVIFEGVNDIGGSRGNSEKVAAELIEAYKQFIEQGHAAGMKVYGATITPFKGNGYWSWFHEAARQTVNDWIRSCGLWDGVIDFDQLVRDPDDPSRLKADYSDDWLHLNPTGYEAMGRYAATLLR